MTSKVPLKAINAVEQLLIELRTYMHEAERATSVRVGGYMISRASTAAKLNAIEARIAKGADAIRASIPPSKMPQVLAEALSKVQSACPLSEEAMKARSRERSADRPLQLHEGEMLAWKFWEERKAVILDLEELLGSSPAPANPTSRRPQAALTRRESLILQLLDQSRREGGGRGITAPEIWSRQPKNDRVSEDRIRRIISDLRNRGVPIPNSGNGGGYLLARPASEVLQELGITPPPPT